MFKRLLVDYFLNSVHQVFNTFFAMFRVFPLRYLNADLAIEGFLLLVFTDYSKQTRFSLLLQDGQSVSEVMVTSLLLGTETGDGGTGRRTSTLDWTDGCCGPGVAPAAPPPFSCLSSQSGPPPRLFTHTANLT